MGSVSCVAYLAAGIQGAQIKHDVIARGVMVIVVENGYGDVSSNPGRD